MQWLPGITAHLLRIFYNDEENSNITNFQMRVGVLNVGVRIGK